MVDDIENDFRWQTVFTKVKSTSIVVESIQRDDDPTLNFHFEKQLVDHLKTLTPSQQQRIEERALILANVQPKNMSDLEFRRHKHDLLEKENKKSLEWFTRALNHNDVAAQDAFVLAGLYIKKQDSSTAFKWYLEAANRGHIEACFEVGHCYYYSYGTEVDEEKAVKYYTLAANANHAISQVMLGDCYRHGRGIIKDKKQAFDFYTKSSNQDNAEAYHALGECYQHGIGIELDYKKAVEWFVKGTGSKNLNSYISLGDCYRHGRGVDKNINRAIEMYTYAAHQNHAEAQLKLGECYYYWRDAGVQTNDHEKAVVWFTKSANAGNANAQCHLGFCYKHGDGVQKDEKKAFELFTLSANNQDPDPDAFDALGDYYKLGLAGVTQDLDKAVDLYKLASEKSSRNGKASLAICYLEGVGVRQDKSKALQLFLESTSGDTIAAQALMKKHETFNDKK